MLCALSLSGQWRHLGGSKKSKGRGQQMLQALPSISSGAPPPKRRQAGRSGQRKREREREREREKAETVLGAQWAFACIFATRRAAALPASHLIETLTSGMPPRSETGETKATKEQMFRDQMLGFLYDLCASEFTLIGNFLVTTCKMRLPKPTDTCRGTAPHR